MKKLTAGLREWTTRRERGDERSNEVRKPEVSDRAGRREEQRKRAREERREVEGEEGGRRNRNKGWRRGGMVEEGRKEQTKGGLERRE